MESLKAIKAKERWAKLSEEERAELTKRISKGMRGFWKGKSAKERSDIAKKAAATRKANIAAKAKGDAK